MKSISDSVIAVIIPEGAHHLDLRGANDLDFQSVRDARDVHRQNIKKWINQSSSFHSVTSRDLEVAEDILEENDISNMEHDNIVIEVLP